MLYDACVKLRFALAEASDRAALAALHRDVVDELTRRFGQGRWSGSPSEKVILLAFRKPKYSKVLIARGGRRIVGTLHLHTKKSWAIDIKYFSKAERPLYLTGMAVEPSLQRQGIGRLLLQEAAKIAREWPADTIRLDAFDAEAGAGDFYAKSGFREVARVSYKGNPLIYFELMLS